MPLFDRLKALFARKSRLDVKARFELLREAISGTMSKVYMARDRQDGQIVSLKVLDPEKTKLFEARFKGLAKPTEGEIAVQFEHPFIVKTFEHGLTVDRAQYIVMEYLGGAGMNSLLVGNAPILEGNRLKFIRQVAEALQVVHEGGFIHRDICPRNLILTGDQEILKLTDFGLTVPATRPFMLPGNRTGTPNYMAPELVRRYSTDQRLDVFSFGVTTYEVFTNELPWPRGATGMAAMAHDRQPEDIRVHRPRIDPTLAEAIHACIDPDLKKRCGSMAEFIERIEYVRKEDAGR